MSEAPERIWIDEHGGNWSPVNGGTQRHEYVRADLFAATLARAERAEAECDKLSISLQLEAALLKEAQFERDNNRAKLEIKKRELFDAVAALERAEALLKEAVEALRKMASLSRLSIYLSLKHSDFKVHTMDMLEQAIKRASATLARIQEAKP